MTTGVSDGPYRTPWQVLQDVLRADAAAPRVTFYERTPGPSSGERIELSGKVLVNWVSKAANLLSEEFDVVEGSLVVVHLPAAHWRTTYWCLAAWSLGASVTFVDSDVSDAPDSGAEAPAEADVLVTDVPNAEFDGDQIVVSLPMLARSAAVEVPNGAIDEAKELSTFGDVFSPFETPAPGGRAVTARGEEHRFADLTTSAPADGTRRYLTEPSPSDLVRALAAGTGSIVLVRGPVTDEELTRILAQESAVTA